MRRFKFISLFFVSACLLALNVNAADETSDEEATTAANVVEAKDTSLRITTTIDGLEVLNVAGVEVEATYLEETLGESHGAIVFFHDQGAQLESLGVITPLRHKMIEYGWSTLTVALDYPFESNILLAIEPDAEQVAEEGEPVDAIEEQVEEQAVAETSTAEPGTDTAPGSEEKEDVLPPVSNQQRIDTAVAFLQAKGIERILFLGHGTGGDLAVKILTDLTVPISALILVGVPELSPVAENEFNIMLQPIFEIYGENDLYGIEQAVKKRKLMMKRVGNNVYSERKVIGANHVFYGLESTLAKILKGRLNTLFIKPKEDEK